jgi:two-component system response regulator RstA
MTTVRTPVFPGSTAALAAGIAQRAWWQSPSDSADPGRSPRGSPPSSSLAVSHDLPHEAGDALQRVLIACELGTAVERLADSLRGHRFEVAVVRDASSALDRIRRWAPDTVVLGRSLPGVDAFDVVRELRPAREDLPIIVIATRYDEFEHAVALELGADDYLPGGVSTHVVAARLRALLRRRSAAESVRSQETTLRFGALTLDLRQREAARDGVRLALTGGEFDVLWLLASQAGRVVARREILRIVRGLEYSCIDRSIDNRVYRIRAKLGDTDPAGQRIKTVRNIGYLFSPFGW